MKKLTILYSELAEYTFACLEALSVTGVQIQLIHWPVNPEAPFQFDFGVVNEHVGRDALNRDALIQRVMAFDPDAILCSGWMDKDYLAVCRKFRAHVPVILSMDNHWTGAPRQQVARIVAPFTILRNFNRAFVPGNIQKEYAHKLGFRGSAVQTGFYSADTKKFNHYYQEIQPSKSEQFPKRFLYLGRYVRHKGIFEMWEAFQLFQKKHPEWELWCVGTGDQYDHRVESEGIKHFGFVQPDALLPILKETGVYILPSQFEPWGVSVHEMATAGFPMLLSSAIGAREAFLKEGENGSVFNAGATDAIVEKMHWIASKSNEELLSMGERSHSFGMKHTPQIWTARLMELTGFGHS